MTMKNKTEKERDGIWNCLLCKGLSQVIHHGALSKGLFHNMRGTMTLWLQADGRALDWKIISGTFTAPPLTPTQPPTRPNADESVNLSDVEHLRQTAGINKAWKDQKKRRIITSQLLNHRHSRRLPVRLVRGVTWPKETECRKDAVVERQTSPSPQLRATTWTCQNQVWLSNDCCRSNSSARTRSCTTVGESNSRADQYYARILQMDQ